jgi:Icc-related predicted phosphoesterase
MCKKPRLIKAAKPRVHFIKLGKKITELEAKREKLFKHYRDRCDRFITRVLIKEGRKEEEHENLEDEKWQFRQSIQYVLPKRLIKLQHNGTLKILAFSDYRIHDIGTLIDFISSLKDEPDIIIYGGDDIRRFSPTPLEFLEVSAVNEEYPVEIEPATISSPERGRWVSSSEYGLILRLPRGAYTKDYVQKRLSKMLEVTSCIYEALKNSDIRSDKNQIAILEKLIADEFPFLTIKNDEKEVRIIDKSTNTAVLSLMKFHGYKLFPWRGYWHLLQSQLNGNPVQIIEKIGKDKRHEYFYIATNQPESNIFEKLASHAKYGLAAIIGNDDNTISRAWIRGKKVYELHNTWLKIGTFLVIGLEGSTCGMGPSGKYLESDVKIRLELASEMLKSNDKLVIVSHTPPKGLLDRAMRFGDEAIGSLALRDFIEECERPTLVICGHVHRCGGRYEKLGKATVVNVSSHDSPFDRANIAWILIDEEGNVDVRLIKLPSLIEQAFKKQSKDQLLETLKKRAFLSETEAILFTDTFERVKDKLFDDLPALANFKFKYGFSWNNIFQFYLRGIKTPEQLTETVYREMLSSSWGIHKIHLMRGYAKIKRELNKEKINLINRIPLPSQGRVIVYDTEYSGEVGVLYGFLDLDTGELKQFWFDEKEEAYKYLKGKENYLFVHWGGSDKKMLKEELNCNAPTLNLLYHVQISLVAPISSATLRDVYDVLCGHKEDDWWKKSFYEIDGLYKLMLCNRILMNPDDNDARKELMDANKADILALRQVMEKLEKLNSTVAHQTLSETEVDNV